jgi:hypothetical protein
MMCLSCKATVAEFWWWCPDCGGTVDGEDGWIDHHGGYPEYSVEWVVPISYLVEHGSSTRPHPHCPTNGAVTPPGADT